jgi:hypothetical protein
LTRTGRDRPSRHTEVDRLIRGRVRYAEHLELQQRDERTLHQPQNGHCSRHADNQDRGLFAQTAITLTRRFDGALRPVAGQSLRPLGEIGECQ